MLLRATAVYVLGVIGLMTVALAAWQHAEIYASREALAALAARADALNTSLKDMTIKANAAERRALVAEDNLAQSASEFAAKTKLAGVTAAAARERDAAVAELARLKDDLQAARQAADEAKAALEDVKKARDEAAAQLDALQASFKSALAASEPLIPVTMPGKTGSAVKSNPGHEAAAASAPVRDETAGSAATPSAVVPAASSSAGATAPGSGSESVSATPALSAGDTPGAQAVPVKATAVKGSTSKSRTSKGWTAKVEPTAAEPNPPVKRRPPAAAKSSSSGGLLDVLPF